MPTKNPLCYSHLQVHYAKQAIKIKTQNKSITINYPLQTTKQHQNTKHEHNSPISPLQTTKQTISKHEYNAKLSNLSIANRLNSITNH